MRPGASTGALAVAVALAACGPSAAIVEREPAPSTGLGGRAAPPADAPPQEPPAACVVDAARDFADLRAPRVVADVGGTTWLTADEALLRLTEDGLGLEPALRLDGNPVSHTLLEDGSLRLGVVGEMGGRIVDVGPGDASLTLGRWPASATWTVNGTPEALATADRSTLMVIRRPDGGRHLALYHVSDRPRAVASHDLGSVTLPLDLGCAAGRCRAYVIGPRHVSRYESEAAALSDTVIRPAAGVTELHVLEDGRLLWILSSLGRLAVAWSNAEGGDFREALELSGIYREASLVRRGPLAFVTALEGGSWRVARVHPDVGPLVTLPFDGLERMQAWGSDDHLLLVGLDDDAPRAVAVLVTADGRVTAPLELGGDSPQERRWLNARVARRGGVVSVVLSTSLRDGAARIVRLGGCVDQGVDI